METFSSFVLPFETNPMTWDSPFGPVVPGLSVFSKDSPDLCDTEACGLGLAPL